MCALSHVRSPRSTGPSLARQAQLLEAGFMERALACLGSSNKRMKGEAVHLLAGLTCSNGRACRRLLRDQGSMQAVAECCLAWGAGSLLHTGEA